MFEAVIAAIVTLVVVIVVCVAVFRIRARREKRSDHLSSRSSINSIDTVVAPRASSSILSSDAPKASSPQGSSGRASDGLRSRFMALGVLAAVVFGTLTLRLWGLQILEGRSYRQDAQDNLYTTVLTPAPRGIIYDANGIELVNNKIQLTVLADPDVANDRDVMVRLSALLGIPYNVIKLRIEDSTSGMQGQRVVASDVSLRDVSFIVEHADAFPGVTTEDRTVRNYPWGALAAHALGYTGTVSQEQLSTTEAGREIQSGDSIGQSGVEQTYDDLLAGDHGVQTLIVDSNGNVKEVVSETEPTRGNDLHLTIVAPIQKIVDKGLASLVSGQGRAGALVAMDVTNGDIVAMANYPTFNPGTFVGGISQEVWDAFNTPESYYPLLNRVVAGAYPPASTFKAFTGMAGIAHGFITDDSTWNCTGVWTGFGEGFPQKCWLEGGHGELDFEGAVVNSCDTAFYEVAKDFYEARSSIGLDAMQDYVKRFGFEQATGIDIGGEVTGRIPTPEWKADFLQDAPEEASWQPGDMSNMVIGQGYVLATPLQLAVAYGAIATGKIVTPHLLKDVRNSVGDAVVSYKASERPLDADEEDLKKVRQALRAVVEQSSEVSSYFVGIPAAGKTGTAEFTDKNDHALFVCYAPYDNPKYVISCIIEEGVSGASTASPLCAEVMAALLEYEDGALDTTMEFIGSTYEAGVDRNEDEAQETTVSGTESLDWQA